MKHCSQCSFAAWNVSDDSDDICPAHLQGGAESLADPCCVFAEICRLEQENELLRDCIAVLAKAKSKPQIKRILTQAGLEPKTEG